MKLAKVSCKYGAPMGRAGDTREGFCAFAASEFAAPRVRLARVPIDQGGYDNGGAYWGVGVPLWRAESTYLDGTESAEHYFRALDRETAKLTLSGFAQVRYGHTMRFFR